MGQMERCFFTLKLRDLMNHAIYKNTTENSELKTIHGLASVATTCRHSVAETQPELTRNDNYTAIFVPQFGQKRSLTLTAELQAVQLIPAVCSSVADQSPVTVC